MTPLTTNDFTNFFESLYRTRDGQSLSPMSWQSELAAAACEGDWPDYISVPTGAGKTSTIEIAIFALAAQAHLPASERTAAMRTFLVVDRRTVVSEAFVRAERLKRLLANASHGILKTVAERLRSYSGNSPTAEPLSVVQLRGGIFRDRNWCSSLTQPMIVTSTVDQVGSRLLFRGYGVSPLARPIQAAAVAHDSLVILDEAHISGAFSQTLGYVRRYQQRPWLQEYVPRPLRVVEMTATPPANSQARKLEVDSAELADGQSHIGRIVNTAKPANLVVAEKVSGSKAPDQLAAVLVEQALDRVTPTAEESASASDVTRPSAKVVGIMCNMVATAKATVGVLLKQKGIEADQVHLIIGAMRPLDRDRQMEALGKIIATGADRSQLDKPIYVVATQCIEVGADYDFDIMVTEAAPLDSLTQRFGRLNRAARDIEAAACIVMRGDYVKSDDQLESDEGAFKFVDLIYGNATSYTWNWLQSVSQHHQLDFGIASLKRLTGKVNGEQLKRMSPSRADAPVLLPAHLDLLCQTSQTPWPDPDVSLWLHGPRRSDPEVQICWRADLLPPSQASREHEGAVEISLAPFAQPDRHEELLHALSLCPPMSPECLSVPLRRVRSWLTSLAKSKRVEADMSGDIPAIVENAEDPSQKIPIPFRPIAWRGLERSAVITDVREIRPGDTLVLTPLAGGWDELGNVPGFSGRRLRDELGRPLIPRLQKLQNTPQSSVLCNAEDYRAVTRIDLGNVAFVQTRQRPIARLHPDLVFDEPSVSTLFAELQQEDNGNPFSKLKLLDRLKQMSPEVSEHFEQLSPRQLSIEYYAKRHGIVVTGPLIAAVPDLALFGDDESDAYSQIAEGQPVELSEHLDRVRAETLSIVKGLSLGSLAKTFEFAASMHDWGKADPRFQALLLGGDAYFAEWEEALYAKSARMPTSLREREEARATSRLPRGFRHEMLSLALAETHPDVLGGVEDVDLLLHLIASHHGHARPWAPCSIDDDPQSVSLDRIGLPAIKLSAKERETLNYHRIDSSAPSRFWKVNRKYGWWGLTALEAVLRLADQRVSQRESLQQSHRPKITSRDGAAVS